MHPRRMQATLRLLGGVALVTAMATILTGSRGVTGARPATDRLAGAPTPAVRRGAASIDSELRFFAAWYAGAGALMLKAARRPEAEAATIAGIGGVWALSAVARLLSARGAGRPHPLFLVLTAAEFSIAGTLLAWHRHRGQPAATSRAARVRS